MTIYQLDLASKDKEKLKKIYRHFETKSKELAGYPCNLRFNYSEIFHFLKFSLNNIGDPYEGSHYQINTHEIERDVIKQFAQWTKAEDDEIWGYVTNGGTEGNLYGLYLAREVYPEGIVYYSEDSHYSVEKILQILRIRNMTIRSKENGEIDYDDLYEAMKTNRDTPAIIFANIGTTMKGAVDDLKKIKKIMKSLAVRHSYIHADCALSGMILPFVEDPTPFNFEDGADSMSISGHKLIGSPIPCGVILAKKHNVKKISREIQYVGIRDTTINGSRNGFTPLVLWYAIRRYGFEGFKQIVQSSFKMADYVINSFEKKGVKAWRNKHSITVVFPRPSEKIIKFWQLAPQNEIAHIIVLPHLTKKIIANIVKDVVNSYK